MKTITAIDSFIQSIEAGTKQEIEAGLKYCKEQSKDFRLQAIYRNSYKTMVPIFKSKLDQFSP